MAASKRPCLLHVACWFPFIYPHKNYEVVNINNYVNHLITANNHDNHIGDYW